MVIGGPKYGRARGVCAGCLSGGWRAGLNKRAAAVDRGRLSAATPKMERDQLFPFALGGAGCFGIFR